MAEGNVQVNVYSRDDDTEPAFTKNLNINKFDTEESLTNAIDDFIIESFGIDGVYYIEVLSEGEVHLVPILRLEPKGSAQIPDLSNTPHLC